MITIAVCNKHLCSALCCLQLLTMAVCLSCASQAKPHWVLLSVEVINFPYFTDEEEELGEVV